MNKKVFVSIIVFLLLIVLGGIGIYLSFFASNTDKFDSKVRAYKIDPNLVVINDLYVYSSDSYYPIYYFKVNDKEYECKSFSGSSIKPNTKKNMVYYDSDNPNKCINEYEKNTSKVAGIILLVVTGVVTLCYLIGTKHINSNSTIIDNYDSIKDDKVSENANKAVEVYEKIQLIITRIILGGFIIFLFVFILIDVGIVVQTIKSKDYIETTATYVETIENIDNSEFNECKYTFLDKRENTQEIKISFCDEPRDKVKIKYNENNPQDYYEENSIMSKSGWIWFYGKLILFALLIGIFCNKDLLKRTSISISKN